MPTDLPPWAPTVLLVAGAISGVMWVVRTFGASVNDRILASVLLKLLDARNVSRALKLLTAVGEAPVGQAAKAALLACAAAEPAALSRAGYRGGAEAEAHEVLAPVRARYDEAFGQAMRRIRTARLLAMPSPILLVLAGVAALRIGSETSYQVAAGAGIGLLILAWTVRRGIDIARGRDRLFAALELQFEALAREGARGLLTPDQVGDARSQSSIA